MSKAERLTGRQRSAFYATLRRMIDPPPCEYGHYGCSTTEGGPCENELWMFTAEGKREIAESRREEEEARRNR